MSAGAAGDLKPVLARLATGASLSEAEAEAAFGTIMAGEATPAQIAGLLMAMRVRGETVAEITGAVRAMRSRMSRVEAPPGAIDVLPGAPAAIPVGEDRERMLVVYRAWVAEQPWNVCPHGVGRITTCTVCFDALCARGAAKVAQVQSSAEESAPAPAEAASRPPAEAPAAAIGDGTEAAEKPPVQWREVPAPDNKPCKHCAHGVLRVQSTQRTTMGGMAVVKQYRYCARCNGDNHVYWRR
jgi:hypothetical protein